MRHYVLTPDRVSQRWSCFDRYEPLHKHAANPVFAAEMPWEGQHVAWPTILRSPETGHYRMWYMTVVETHATPDETLVIDNTEVAGTTYHFCYAESADGLHWERPALNIVATDRYPDNNIILAGDGRYIDSPSVIDDSFETDPAKRYKMAYFENAGLAQGVRTLVSADGIHWQEHGTFPVIPAQDALRFSQDPATGIYQLNMKDRVRNRRSRLLSQSRDFSAWSEPVPDITPDIGDDESTHFYDAVSFPFGDTSLGFLTIYDEATRLTRAELVAGQPHGQTKRLPSRPTVLAPGDPGSWDGGGVYTTAGGPIPQADGTMRYYYYGSRTRHEKVPPVDGPKTGFGIATYQADRLCGQQFVGHGSFITIPLLCTAPVLTVNADAGDALRVAVTSCGYAKPHPGYDTADCAPVSGDSHAHPIAWQTAHDLRAFVGHYIRLHITGTNSRVYSLTLSDH